MKHVHFITPSTCLFVLIPVALLLMVFSGCNSYNPHTGRYEPDAGKTMMAVGSAALAGSIIYNETSRDNDHHPPHHYQRPPNHYHYHGSPPHH